MCARNFQIIITFFNEITSLKKKNPNNNERGISGTYCEIWEVKDF